MIQHRGTVDSKIICTKNKCVRKYGLIIIINLVIEILQFLLKQINKKNCIICPVMIVLLTIYR